MKRLVPRSLAGQMAILIGVALLVAQLANMALLLNEREKLTLAQAEGPAISQFVSSVSDYLAAKPEQRAEVLDRRSRRGARFEIKPQSSIAPEARRPGLEARLQRALTDAEIPSKVVRAARRDEPVPFRTDWPRPGEPRSGERSGAPQSGFSWPGDFRGGEPRRDFRQIQLAVQLSNAQWIEGRIITPGRDPVLTVRLISATIFLYFVVLGVTVAIAAWLARPLRDLTASAEAFGGRDASAEVKVRGPGDLRRLIIAFNAMSLRVLALMDEKDRMLGAIGHDLRTPLASLRIRAENMDPPEERERLVATIEEAAAMLEDILVLARTGRSREAARDMDLDAMLDALVEEYRELGRPVTLVPGDRLVARIQPGLLRRAVRNLVDNAVSYGGSASIEAERRSGEVVISICDNGAGIPDEDLARVLEPFERGEESRNRATGGSGLGLAIASAIAQGHGGRLTLANRPGGGLKASLHLPS